MKNASWLLPCIALAAALAAPAPAAAAPRLFGLGAGAAVNLDPTDSAGVAASVSAAIPADMGQLLWFRGSITGLFTGSSWAVMPTLGGAIGGRVGPLALFVSGGVQLFGVAHRAEETALAVFGVNGGLGAMFDLAAGYRLGLRGEVLWLPSIFSASIEAPEEEPESSLLFVVTQVVFEFGGESSD